MNPSSLLQATLKLFCATAILVSIVAAGVGRLVTKTPEEWLAVDIRRSLDGAWAEYKQTFIASGQLKRPLAQHDSTAEGQANAMLRAVWLDDRATFDALYQWTERFMSRRQMYDDHLLAQRMGPDATGNYTISEWSAPADANLDYAFALFQAHYRWGAEQSPGAGLPPYREKALLVAKDLLGKAVVLHPGTRELIQLPWCRPEFVSQEPTSILLSPADYSPAHYRLFHEETGDPRWKQMLDNSYDQMNRLLTSVDGEKGGGLAPDWVRMRPDGNFSFDATHKASCMVESFRMWWRVRMDLYLSGEPRARQLLEKWLVPLIPKVTTERDSILAARYDYNGAPTMNYENPGAIGALAWALEGLSSGLSATYLRSRLQDEYTVKNPNTGEIYFGGDAKDFDVNTWAWYGMAVEEYAWPFRRLNAAEAAPAADAKGRTASLGLALPPPQPR